MNFEKFLKENERVVVVCKIIQQFNAFKKYLPEFFCDDDIIDENLGIKSYIKLNGDVSFEFIEGKYDGWCYKAWFESLTRPYKYIYWIERPTFIEVDE